MNASLLLATLRGRGVTVACDGDRLELDAPKGALSDLLPELQRFKPSLLELLEEERAHSMALLLADQSRKRLARLVERLGNDGACRVIVAIGRRLKHEKPDFWRQLSASDRHDLAICVALLGR